MSARRLSVSTCSTVSAVPSGATTSVNSAWCSVMTSKLPSTSTARPCLLHALARLREPEQQLALLVDRALGAVDVLRRLAAVGAPARGFADHARREPDDLAAGHDHRADQPIAIHDRSSRRAFGCGRDEAEPTRELEVDALGLQVIGERVPVRRRVAELELVGRLGADAALVEVRAAELAALRIGEHLAKERGRVLVDVEHRDALAARPPQLRRLVDLRHRDVEPRAELLGRLDEALALELHHEREHVAVLLAAEAVEEALVGHRR